MNVPEKEEGVVCASCGAEMDNESLACFHCGTARRSAPLKKGQVISDRYELTNLLGRGGMGTVYEAHDRSLDERVALKVLSEAARGSGDADRRFRDEIKLARKIRHPNVCGIHEYGKDQDVQYIVMEFVDGQDLKKYVRSRGKLTTDEALDLACQMGEGLQAIHDAGVVHRDLKLPNVMRDSNGRLRLMDFGIAKFMGDATATATGHIIGTPEYMSPEQVQGLRVDPRSDLYSLAVMTYELLTGRVPFKADTPLATIMLQVHEPPRLEDPTIPLNIAPILSKALAKRPEDRYENVRAYVAALAAVRAGSVDSPAPLPSSPARVPLPPPPATTMDIVTPRVAPVHRYGERPAWAKSQAPPQAPPKAGAKGPVAPVPNRSSERRFGLWLGVMGGAVLGLGATVWLAMQVAETLRNRQEPKPAPTMVAPTELATEPEPASTPAAAMATASPAATPSVRVAALTTPNVSSTSPRSAPSPSPRNRPVRTPPPLATPTSGGSRPPELARRDAVTAVQEPARPQVTPPPLRTPLPSAVLTTLPNPTPSAVAAAATQAALSALQSAASTPEASLPAALAVGHLQLGAKPYARVSVDGKEVGTLPMGPVELSPGKHVVRFVHPDFQPLQRTVTIRPGETLKLFIDWSMDGIAK
jgi:serine/threonine-protein kinase